MNRGDVILVRFPHPSGMRGKKRPAVIVQSDAYAGAIRTILVAEITSNLIVANDPACVFINANTADGKATGLVRDSVISLLAADLCLCGYGQSNDGYAFACPDAETRRVFESRT